MDAFRVDDLIAGRQGREHVYEDVLRSDLLSVGLATWPAGSADTQEPHTEDEVYHVVRGRAVITVAGERLAVGPGSVVFVGTGVEHRFSDIEEDLHVIVFWAPPRRSRR